MEKELVNLVKKLLKRTPTSVYDDPFNDYSIVYKNGDVEYRISICKINQLFTVELHISNYKINSFTHYDSNITEREYMEIKWSIENWKQTINDYEFDAFREFVEDDTQMDDLLND